MDFTVSFKEEIELITDEDYLQEFVKQAFARVPVFQLEEEVDYVKRVVSNVRAMSEVLDADDKVKDMMITAALLHSICKYDEVDGVKEHDYIHMFHVRGYLSDLQNIAGRENYNNVMLLIESQGGFNSPIPQVMPRLEDPAHMWILPFAIKLAQEHEEYET
jgi:hypothetical protein